MLTIFFFIYILIVIIVRLEGWLFYEFIRKFILYVIENFAFLPGEGISTRCLLVRSSNEHVALRFPVVVTMKLG